MSPRFHPNPTIWCCYYRYELAKSHFTGRAFLSISFDVPIAAAAGSSFLFWNLLEGLPPEALLVNGDGTVERTTDLKVCLHNACCPAVFYLVNGTYFYQSKYKAVVTVSARYPLQRQLHPEPDGG